MSDAMNDDTPVLDLLARMTADSLEASGLDAETLILVRIAALVAVDAPPVSYALNLEVGAEAGLDADAIRDVLTAIAPIVGTAAGRRRDRIEALGIATRGPEHGAPEDIHPVCVMRATGRGDEAGEHDRPGGTRHDC